MISQAPHSEMGPLRYFFCNGAVFEQPADGVAGLKRKGNRFTPQTVTTSSAGIVRITRDGCRGEDLLPITVENKGFPPFTKATQRSILSHDCGRGLSRALRRRGENGEIASRCLGKLTQIERGRDENSSQSMQGKVFLQPQVPSELKKRLNRIQL